VFIWEESQPVKFLFLHPVYTVGMAYMQLNIKLGGLLHLEQSDYGQLRNKQVRLKIPFRILNISSYIFY